MTERETACLLRGCGSKKKKERLDRCFANLLKLAEMENGSLLSHKEGYESPFQFAAVGFLI
jgi:hypothetical protein